MRAGDSSAIEEGEPAKRDNPWYQAQAILSRRDHSVYEMEMKLKRKGFSATEIAEVIVRLKERGWLDDSKFALALAENTVLFKAVGPRALLHKLREKNIAEAVRESVVARVYADDREIELAREAAGIWLKRKRGLEMEEQKKSARLRTFLISRGFTGEVVARVMGEIKESS